MVALRQLRALGLTARAVRSRVAAGRLHPVHGGVYAVGHCVLTIHGRWMAAVLACGPGAALSHRDAAALHRLMRPTRTAIDVTSPTRAGRSRAGIDVHRAGNLAPGDVTTVQGIPCTTLARTLLDLAEVAHDRTLQKALEQAERLDLLDARSLRDVLSRNPTRRAAPRLHRALHNYDPRRTLTRNEMERRFVQACTRAGLPPPEVNSWLEIPPGDWIQPDFLWRSQRVIVEADGYETHGTRRAFEDDRRRDQRTLVLGWRTVRSTWRQVEHAPEEITRTVKALI